MANEWTSVVENMTRGEEFVTFSFTGSLSGVTAQNIEHDLEISLEGGVVNWNVDDIDHILNKRIA